MILEIKCLIIKKKHIFSSTFTFSKQSFLGNFDFWLKTRQNYKSCSKNDQNHQFALLSFTFDKKKSTISHWPFFSDLWHWIAHTNDIYCSSLNFWDKLWKSRGCSLEKLSLGSSQGGSRRELPRESFSRLPEALPQLVRLC